MKQKLSAVSPSGNHQNKLQLKEGYSKIQGNPGLVEAILCSLANYDQEIQITNGFIGFCPLQMNMIPLSLWELAIITIIFPITLTLSGPPTLLFGEESAPGIRIRHILPS